MAKIVIKIIQGFVLGAAGIIPGLSGSVLAVMFAIYDNLIAIAAAPIKNWRSNLRYLWPLGLGALIGFLLFAVVIAQLFNSPTATALVIYLFLGLMVGSLPSLFKEANQQGFRKMYVVVALIAAAICMGMGLWLESVHGGAVSLELNWLTLILCGVILGIGTVVPGLSSSFIFIFLGTYGPLMTAVKDFDWMTLGILGVSILVTILLCARGINWLLNKFYGVAYYIFIGIALGSLVLAFPRVTLQVGEIIGAVLLFIGGVVGAYWLNKIEIKGKEEVNYD